MKYYVGVAIDGRFYVEVEAKDLEEAREKAIEEYENADFGCLECIEAEVINADDEDGNTYDYN